MLESRRLLEIQPNVIKSVRNGMWCKGKEEVRGRGARRVRGGGAARRFSSKTDKRMVMRLFITSAAGR